MIADDSSKIKSPCTKAGTVPWGLIFKNGDSFISLYLKTAMFTGSLSSSTTCIAFDAMFSPCSNGALSKYMYA